MTQRKNVTRRQSDVTNERDTLARARLSFGEDVTVSRCHDLRDVTCGTRDSDTRPVGRRHHHEKRRATPTQGTTWAHIAALNLIADHEAGKSVDAVRLDAARKLVGAS